MKNVHELIGLLDKFIKEIKSGYIYPCKKSPKYILPITVVPKADGISWRFIRNGSSKRGSYISLNDGIVERKYIDIIMRNFYSYCAFFYTANWAAGFDIKSAYRNCF